MAESFAGDGHCGPAGEKQPAVLHVYAHNYHHYPCALVGNRKGLARLRDLLTAVLDGTAPLEPLEDFVPADDGEGYSCHVFMHDVPFRDPSWDRMPVRYETQSWVDHRIRAAIVGKPFRVMRGCPDCQGDVAYESWSETRGLSGREDSEAALAEHKKACPGLSKKELGE